MFLIVNTNDYDEGVHTEESTWHRYGHGILEINGVSCIVAANSRILSPWMDM